jgi:hypothetical protein
MTLSGVGDCGTLSRGGGPEVGVKLLKPLEQLEQERSDVIDYPYELSLCMNGQ